MVGMTQITDHEQLAALIEKNNKVLEENNELLKQMHFSMRVSFWFRVFWYVTLVGLPFLFYFYIVEPYFALFGSNLDVFLEGMKEIPGYKYISDAICEVPLEQTEIDRSTNEGGLPEDAQ